MTDIATVEELKDFLPPGTLLPGEKTPYQLLPLEYQGWFLLIFIFVGTIAIVYGLYIVNQGINQKQDGKNG